MRRRARWLLAAVVALVVVAFAAFFFFEPRYDVPSIAATSSYKDPALIEAAWALPVAAKYHHELSSQTNASVCGPSSLANVFRSLGESTTSESAVLAGSGKCKTGYCLTGLTLDELAEIARGKTSGTSERKRKVTVHRDLDRAAFHALLLKTNDPSRRFVVNFHRGLLFGKGGGHHSPIAGYLEDRDLVFILDVNGRFGPWLVSSERLFAAIDSVDTSSGRKRGLLEIE